MYLIIAALLALGYWGYTRTRSGLPLLPGATRTPAQVAASELPPELSVAFLDLLNNGRNAQAMHAAATELERYGFFESAMLLHKRADELTPPPAGQAPLPRVPPIIPLPPGVIPPGTPADTAAAIQSVRSQMGALNLQWEDLNLLIRQFTPQRIAEWNNALNRWRQFYTQPVTPLNVAQVTTEFRGQQNALDGWRIYYDRTRSATAPSVTAPVPTTPPQAPTVVEQIPPGTFVPLTARGTISRPINVRAQPDMTSPILAAMTANTAVNIIGSMGDYYQINYQGNIGWLPKTAITLSTIQDPGVRRGIS